MDPIRRAVAPLRQAADSLPARTADSLAGEFRRFTFKGKERPGGPGASPKKNWCQFKKNWCQFALKRENGTDTNCS
jgi:hypothetical protein